LTFGTRNVKFYDMIFNWDDKKNELLKKNRRISFEEIILCISEGKLIDILEHPNKLKYPNQKIYLVERDDYIYAVPFIEDKENNQIFLKTIFPTRKYTKKYLTGGKTNE